jgi:solute carrier family 25 citrate transporter 1
MCVDMQLISGLLSSYVTQPLDTVKTRWVRPCYPNCLCLFSFWRLIKVRMQSLEASKNYKNSFACAAKIFKDEGITTFWSGAVPRLVRLILSGGIVFTMSVSPITW